jgi:hypothetical protein
MIRGARKSGFKGNSDVGLRPEGGLNVVASDGKDAVAYCRVSTRGQAKSGLGIDAQKEAIKTFAKANGFRLVDAFEETESGKGARFSERFRSEMAFRCPLHVRSYPNSGQTRARSVCPLSANSRHQPSNL